MAWFKRKPAPEARIGSLAELEMILNRSGLTTSGIVVDDDKAMRHSAVWAAVELVAGVGASLPIDEYRTQAGKQVQVPLSGLFADPDPDPSVSAQAFRAQVLRSVATCGNAYAQLLGDLPGTPSGMCTIHPSRASWRWEKQDGAFQWQLYIDNKPRSRWPYGDVWHFALFQQPGSPIGLSPVEYHKQSIGSALAAQKFGQQFFDGGGNPSIIIKPPVRLADAEAKALKQSVLDVTRGNRDPLVMPQEIQIEKMSIPADDSQFLETQRYGVEEIARVFLGGFPELIGGATSGQSVTYANREQRMADFIALSLSPRYLVPLEAALSSLVPRGRYVKHNVNALLRSDLTARYASYKTSAEVSKIMGAPLQTINEMRALEDMPPVPGGDEMAPAAEPPATKVQIVDPDARTLEPVAELRTWDPPSPQEVHVHAHFPEQRHDVTIPVTVASPEVQVRNDVHVPEQTPPVVHVDARTTVEPAATPDVHVHVPEPRALRKSIEHDNAGRIVAVTEEYAE